MTTNMRLPKTLIALWLGVLLLFAVGVVAYVLGLAWTLVSETDEACSQGLIYKGAAFQGMREGFIPLERTCVFADGTTYEDIPVWANPLFFGGLAGSAGCAAVAVYRRKQIVSG